MAKTKNKSERKEKLKKEFENGFDKFERKPFAEQLTKVITRYTPLYEEAFVLSLNAPWGAGKTAFLAMWKNYLESQKDPYEVISINAWETDFDEEPLIPIISALYSHVENTSASEEFKKSMKEGLGGTALVLNDVVAHFTGGDLRKVVTEVQKENRSISEIGEDLYKGYSFKKEAYKKLRDELQKYAGTLGGRPLVIFVDELDRVRPDYAVKFLEAIKHIFSVKGVCFVLAVDKIQLEHSVKQLYGGIDFQNYYRRFVTREANLPEILNIDFKGFLEREFSPFFSDNDNVGSFLPIKTSEKDVMVDLATAVCKCFRFNPRQMKDWCRSLIHFIAVDVDDVASVENQVHASMLLVAISMDKENASLYENIGLDVDYASDLSSYIQSLDYSWYSGGKDYKGVLLSVAMAFSLRSKHYDSKQSHNINPIMIWSDYEDKTSKNRNSDLTWSDKRHYSIQDLRACLGGLSDAPASSNFCLLQRRMEMWNNLTEEKA